MTDDVIRSMEAQMQPSDQVVSPICLLSLQPKSLPR